MSDIIEKSSSTAAVAPTSRTDILANPVTAVVLAVLLVLVAVSSYATHRPGEVLLEKSHSPAEQHAHDNIDKDIGDVDALRIDLLALLSRDNLIESSHQEVLMDIEPDRLRVNGITISQQLTPRYYQLLESYSVTPASSKIVKMNFMGTASIGVGFQIDNALIGTWSIHETLSN